MSSENFSIKSEKLNAKVYLPPNAMTQNLINVRRQYQKLRLQKSCADY
jgi:hypothetical protein